MDLFDIQEVESKLSDVTVIPIPRSQTQNSRNYQREQREQREQYDEQREQYKEREQKKQREQHKQRGHRKQRELHGQYEQHMQYKQREQYKQRKQNERREQTGIQNTSALQHRQMDHYNNAIVRAAGGQNYDLVAKAKDYYQKQLNSAVAATALQYTQQLQAQLALLQRQANNNLTITPTNPMRHNNINIGGGLNNDNDRTGVNYQYQIDLPKCSQGIVTTQKSPNITAPMTETSNLLTAAATGDDHDFVGKYSTLLALIEEMRRDIRPTYTGSRNSTERLKRSIAHARMLINECLGEIEGKPRQ
uniref:Cyclin-dependent kinase 2-associated protein n=1 Tax=Glossina morsitans morsitans TaxID=37546 RepID=A0A1B0G642_GLOMM